MSSKEEYTQAAIDFLRGNGSLSNMVRTERQAVYDCFGTKVSESIKGLYEILESKSKELKELEALRDKLAEEKSNVLQV